MNALRLLTIMLCTPLLLASSLSAAEKSKGTTAATNKPSLTYYFFDG